MKHYLTSRCVRGLQVYQMKYDLENKKVWNYRITVLAWHDSRF